MKKTRFSEEQMVTILREADTKPVPDVAKKHGVSAQTIYSWRKHFGSLEPADVKRLRQLEQENGRLKKMVADRDGRRLRNGDGAGCDSHNPTGQDGEHIWPRPAVARAGSDGHVGEAARPAPLEEGVRVPSPGPGGEHVLPLQVHHRRWPSRPESSWAGE